MNEDKRPDLMQTEWIEGTVNGRPAIIERMWMGTYWAPTRKYKLEEGGEVFEALFMTEHK